MKKTSVVSIRINDDEKKALEIEGDLTGITLNALVDKIISRHIRWDRFSREIDSVSINKKTLTVLLNSIEPVKLDEICKMNPMISMKDAILFSKGEFTIDNFLSVFDMWLDTSNISYRHISNSGFDRYIIKHELGHNFSVFLNSLVEKILNELKISLTNIDSNTNHISFEINRIQEVKNVKL
ncbi:MAG: hypothetical protein ACW9W4_08570 [Candidatus Nitrosopumilus sp. bin_7KS]